MVQEKLEADSIWEGRKLEWCMAMAALTLAMLLSFTLLAKAQSPNASAGPTSTVSAATVSSGTRFLVKLDDKLTTR
jgi:hypothetical protein